MTCQNEADHRRPVRILHVSQPTTAGVALCAHRLARHQRGRGIDSQLACPPEGDLLAWAQADGIPLHPWRSRRAPGRAVISELVALGRVVEAVDPDLVHLHSAKAGLVGRLLLRGRRVTVMHPNAWSFNPPGPQRPLARAWERSAGRWTDLVVASSHLEAEQGRAAGIDAPVVVAPNGVDHRRFHPPNASERLAARQRLELEPGEPVALVVGRLCHQKGQDLLVSRWERVRSQVPGARLLVVGAGPTERLLRRSAAVGVRFEGPRGDVRPWLWAADVVVQPSRWEGLSFVTLEALACGVPVVAFAVPGMAESIGTGAGALVPPGAVDPLLDEVVLRLRDPLRAAAEGSVGRLRIERSFTEEQACAAATEATLALLGRRRELTGVR